MKLRANDGSVAAPRLEIQQAMWSMKCYGTNNKEWSLEEKFNCIAEAGFTGIFGALPEHGEEPLWRNLLERNRFTFGLESFPATGEQLVELLEKASDYPVLYVNAQVPNAFCVGKEAITRLDTLQRVAERYNLPLFIETHRGRITQDLLRTVQYVQTLPNLRLTIDLSHYVLAGEMYDFEHIDPYFDELLQRTSSFHGRITNAQQIQINVGQEADHPMVEHFARWWERGMSYWLEQASPGDILPFVCEIGHHYMVTDNYLPAYSWLEHFDRWEQSQVIKRIAEKCWSKAITKSYDGV